MSSKPILLEENNLSSAWCKTLAHIVNNKGREIKPLILSLTGFDEKEAVRTGLDAELEKKPRKFGKNCFRDHISSICLSFLWAR